MPNGSKRKPTKRKRHPGGRPRKIPDVGITEERVAEMIGFGLSVEEVAKLCRVSKDTLERNYRDAIELGRVENIREIHQTQRRLMLQGSSRMAQWRGIQFCGQDSHPKPSGDTDSLAELTQQMRLTHADIVEKDKLRERVEQLEREKAALEQALKNKNDGGGTGPKEGES